MLNAHVLVNCRDNNRPMGQFLSKHQSFLIRKAVGLATLIMIIILYAGCSTEPTKPIQAPPATNSSKGDSRQSDATVTPSPELKEIRLEGITRDQFDSIVKHIGARSAGEMLASTIAVASEGLKRPPKTAKVRSTIGDFSGKDTVKSDKGDCEIAVSGGEVQIEAAGDGSNAKMISVPTDSVAKIYCDFALSMGIVIPKGTMLRREAEGWVSFRDAEAEKHLDAIK